MRSLPRYFLGSVHGALALYDASGGYVTHGIKTPLPDVCLVSDVVELESEVVRLLDRVEELKR